MGRKAGRSDRGFEAADHQWLAAVACILSMNRKEHGMVVQTESVGRWGRSSSGLLTTCHWFVSRTVGLCNPKRK